MGEMLLSPHVFRISANNSLWQLIKHPIMLNLAGSTNAHVDEKDGWMDG